MATHKQIAKDLKNIKFNKIFREVFTSFNLEKWAVEQIQKRLYNQGITGSLIKLRTDKGQPYYTPEYEKIKRKKGQKTSNVTLFLGGGLYQNIKLIFEQKGFKINTDFEYMTVHFKNIYSSEEEGYSDILSLTKHEISQIIEKASQLYIKKINATV